jgi:hypothetical protein
MPGADSQFRITRPFVYRSESGRAPTANPTGIPTARSRGAAESRLALTDPALHVVTDFAWEQPITVPEQISIDAALREMIRAEVRPAGRARRSADRPHHLVRHSRRASLAVPRTIGLSPSRRDRGRSHHDPVGAGPGTRLAGAAPRACLGPRRVSQVHRRDPCRNGRAHRSAQKHRAWTHLAHSARAPARTEDLTGRPT